MRRSSRAAVGGAALVVLLAALPGRASAQFGPPGGGILGWTPSIGIRAGWLLKDDAPALGAVLVVPVPIPILRPTLAAGADVFFQTGLREKQATLDLTFPFLQGLFAGGGPAVMDTYFGTAAERETKTGFTLVAGLGARGGGRGFNGHILVRKLFIDARKPTMIQFELTYPLRALLGG